MDILDRIVADKRIELKEEMARLPLEDLRSRALAASPSSRSMRKALVSGSGIIAEFKRKSPSRGWIHQDISPKDVVPSYASGGASALSILTDAKYFGGKLEYVSEARKLVSIPILRKEFIVSEYQLLQARLAGADAVLLIAACLSLQEFRTLLGQAHSLGLEVLLEVHSEDELGYVSGDVDMVGVNNRNLGTFVTDVANSFQLAPKLRSLFPPESAFPVLVSESGISSPETVLRLRQEGFHGFLMGEAFMKEPDPGAALSAFVKAIA